MFQFSLILAAVVTAAGAADRTTIRPTTTRPTSTHYVPGCNSEFGFSWPSQHAVGDSWREEFEGFCQECTCLATGKVCEACAPRDCFRPTEYLLYNGQVLSAGESAIIQYGPDQCVYCQCSDYWANCNSYPCDGIIA